MNMKPQETQVPKNFVEFLAEKNLLSPGQIEGLSGDLGNSTANPANKIRDMLLEKNLIPEEEIYTAWAEYHSLPYVNLRSIAFEPQALALISSEVARRNVLIPFNFHPGEISVAFDNPETNIVNQLKQRTRCNILLHIASRSHILEAIDVQYGAIDIQTAAEKLDLSQYSANTLESPEFADAKPIVEIANGIIISALKYRASDIHLEPRGDYLQIRFRIDGVMQEKFRLVKAIISPLISRYKIMASLNIVEKRKPQDGRFQYAIGERKIDIRVSVVPTIKGEKIVLRILDKSGMNLDMRQMLFSKNIYSRLEKIVSAPHGAIFVTGPTGSGKTTTLYAVINYLNSIERNIITIEDPVEYQLPLINQIQINMAVGLDFPTVLRSVLRQDPDVIMIGEIRDYETAKIATEAAITGHLVLASLHTNNAIDAALRLIEIGVEPFMVAPSIVGILAQRLARRICQKCKESYVASDEEMAHFGLKPTSPKLQLHRGKGCSSCHGIGYSGRVAIHEIVTVTNEIQELIFQKASVERVAEAAYKVGYRSMRYDGLKKVLRGLTTLSEILRVTTAQEMFWDNDVLG